MEGTKNINKKLLITIFTTPFLIGFFYSVYSQATSSQNNAAISSLESNAIIQFLNSTFNSYSIAGQSLASFLSIKSIPAYVWAIIIFLITTLFFVGIYTFLFEVFMQKIGIKEKENETMRKAIILFIFALSIFSTLAIGFAIPFLLNLYGLILLIFAIIALFFFGRAVISYGRSFHYATKSFEVDVKEKLVNAKKALKEAEKNLPEGDVKALEEGIDKIYKIYEEAENIRKAADTKFKNLSSKLIQANEDFINNLINEYRNYLRNPGQNNLNSNDAQTLNDFINYLENKKNTDKKDLQHILDSPDPDIQKIISILGDIPGQLKIRSINVNVKQKLKDILEKVYHDTLSKHGILQEIQDVIESYKNAEELLKKLHAYEESLNDTELKIRKFLHVYGDRKGEIAMSSALKELKDNIEKTRYLVIKRLTFLEELEKVLH